MSLIAGLGLLLWVVAAPADGQVLPEPHEDFNRVSPPSGTFIAVDQGQYHACAVRTNHALVCWGNGYEGSTTPPPGAFTAVSAFYHHACALRTDATAVCWGDDYQRVPPPAAMTFSAISDGLSSACGIRTDASVLCWHLSGAATGPPPGSYTAVSAGNGGHCGIRSDATLVCWAYSGQDEPSPPPGSYTAVSTSGTYLCAVRTDTTLVCVGAGGWNNDPNAQVTHGQPPAGTGYRSVSVGGTHACAVKTDGTVVCWGGNRFRQATVPPGLYDTVSVGFVRTCARRTDMTLACWGWGYEESAPPAGPGAPGPSPAGPKRKRIPSSKAFKLPSAKRCVSRRHFRIRVRKVPGVTWVRARVIVNGKRVKTLRRKRITAPVDLRGLPKGRYTVKLIAWSNDGRLAKEKRRYRTCAGARN